MLNFLKNAVGAMIESRQNHINREVIKMLRSEYPHESDAHIEYMLNNKLHGVK